MSHRLITFAALLALALPVLSADFYAPDLQKAIKAHDNGVKGDKQSVAAAPEDPYVRLVRAINFWNLPFFVGKNGEAKKDFYLLADQIEKNPGVYDRAMVQGVYYYAGLAHKEDKDMLSAVKMWTTGLNILPGSDIGLKIRRELQSVKSTLTPSSSLPRR